MGLERIAMVCQGVTSTFETDLLRPILDKVVEMSGVEYKKSEKTDVSLRIITDHARCVTFLINDGVIPGNEGRSYVLRMILRRALRHGKILGMELPFLHKLVDVVIENDFLQGCMALRQLVYLLVEVENHGNHHDDGDEEDVCAQELVDDVVVHASQPGLSSPILPVGVVPLGRAMFGAVLEAE